MENFNQPAGMVDHLDSIGAGPTEAEIAYAMASLQPGPMDPALLALAADPARIAAREAMIVERRARDWAQLGQYRDANAALDAGVVKAVFMGDSITELWAAADPDLFRDGVVGRGISGQTSPQMLVRFMADVVALKPVVVHLLCGTNDIAGNTGPTTPQDYKNNVQAIVTLAQAYGLKVIIGSIPPCRDFSWISEHGFDPRPRVAELNAWLWKLADQRGLIWANYHSVLSAADQGMRHEFTRDGVHPGLDGYAAMREVAQAALAQALVGFAAGSSWIDRQTCSTPVAMDQTI
jgi:lysophospholipase L1-like esterase